MPLNNRVVLGLESARRLVSRAIDKTETFGQRGTFIVVDSSGAPITASRMDGTGGAALGVVRAKAFSAAANGENSERFSTRVVSFHPGIYASYQDIMRDRPFPGGGGVIIESEKTVVGAMATGLGIGPFVKLPGVAPHTLLVDGKPANLEDLIISYALETGYRPQHGDDMKRWIDAYGGPPDASIVGTGLVEVPPACGQPILRQAQRLADRAMALATRAGLRISVAVVDRLADVIQFHRMDGAPPMSIDVAEQVAVAAVNFACPTAQIASRFKDPAHLAQILTNVPYRMMTLAGGAPLLVEDRIDGAVGIGGVAPDVAQNIADEIAVGFHASGEAK